MAADFRKRFWISLILTLPILVLSPMLQSLVGLREAIRFPGDIYVLFGLSSAVFWYGGWPFLKGLFEELKSRRPGMMTLVAVAIATAYLYSSAVVFGLTGKMFFWELATLVDIMLLGHWIEMASVQSAGRALVRALFRVKGLDRNPPAGTLATATFPSRACGSYSHEAGHRAHPSRAEAKRRASKRASVEESATIGRRRPKACRSTSRTAPGRRAECSPR